MSLAATYKQIAEEQGEGPVCWPLPSLPAVPDGIVTAEEMEAFDESVRLACDQIGEFFAAYAKKVRYQTNADTEADELYFGLRDLFADHLVAATRAQAEALRMEEGMWEDPNREHRLSACQLGVGRFA